MLINVSISFVSEELGLDDLQQFLTATEPSRCMLARVRTRLSKGL